MNLNQFMLHGEKPLDDPLQRRATLANIQVRGRLLDRPVVRLAKCHAVKFMIGEAPTDFHIAVNQHEQEIF